MQTSDKMDFLNIKLSTIEEVGFALESNQILYSNMLKIYNNKDVPNEMIYEYFYSFLKMLPIYKNAYAEWLLGTEDKNPKNWKNSLRFINHIINQFITIKHKLNSNRE